MIAPTGFTEPQVARSEWQDWIDAERAKATHAWLERAIMWREVSKSYRFTQVERRRARVFMRDNALRWRQKAGGHA